MIKKISAIVLALVLCLSVVVMPASAYTLGSGSEVAYEIRLDKDSYSAGDTVKISLFLYGKEGLEFGTGAIVIGMNSAVFAGTETPADIQASSTSGDAMASWYKDASAATWAWQTNATILTNIANGNTAEENAMFDQYLKIVLAKNASGSHANIGSNKNGIPTEEINADSEAGVAFFSIQLKLNDDIPDGTAINVGIPTGSMPKNYTYMNYYKSPGTLSTVVKTTAATSEIVNSTTATVGEATPELTIVKDKTQINFDPDQNGYYEGTFAIRQFVEFDNLLDVFGTPAEAKDGADGTGLTEVGFVYATTDKYNKTDALAVIDDNTESGTYGAYTLDNDAYISTTAKAGSYVMGYTVKNIADKSVSLTILAYAKYVVNGEEAIATFEIAGDYSDIYSTYESKIPPVKPEA